MSTFQVSTSRLQVFAWVALTFAGPALSRPLRADETQVMSAVVSYRYVESLDDERSTVASSVVSYQYSELPNEESIQFLSSSLASYYFQEAALASPSVAVSPTTQGAMVFSANVQTEFGEPYVVEFKESMTASLWTWLQTLFGNGGVKQYVAVSQTPTGFFRVRKESETVNLYLRLPLPAEKHWLLQTEIGGSDTHNGNNYYSLDLDDYSQESGSEDNVDVLAAANGKVTFSGKSADHVENGYYIVIDHSAPFKGIGYTTRYLHLKKDSLTVESGDIVTQGQKLGKVGNTGLSTGPHLHFGIRYNGNGSMDATEIGRVRLEGMRFEDFKTLDADGHLKYYYSTNVSPP